MVDPTTRPLRSDHHDMQAGWHLAVRVAVAVSILMVAVVYALKHFFGVSDLALVILTAAVGLPIGLSLPAARPPIPQWIDDPSDLFDDADF
jgi:hypothetical protein